LKKEPTMKKTVEFYKPGDENGPNGKLPVGFYTPEGDEDSEGNDNDESEPENEIDDSLDEDTSLPDKIEEITLTDKKNEVSDNSDENEDSDYNDENSSDDDEGWITPSNLKAKNKEMLGANDVPEEETKELVVACLTNDFAMQNVLKQIGLNALSTDGVIIKETKTWILRCYTCFATTPKMDLKFCPKCGNSTLKRVSVTLNRDGTQQIHISTRRPLSTKGKKFSLPRQQGGKYAINPILTADQQIPQQRRSALARMKTNAMGDDYVAGNAPFAVNDVNSKSAMLGFGLGHGNHHWAHKNPNAVGRKTGNRKKKNRN